MVNIGTSASVPTPLATTFHVLDHSPTLAIEAPASAPEVDQHVDIATTLSVEESTSPPISTNRTRNLPEGNKMELTSKLSHSMFKASTIFSPVSAGWGNVLDPNNPFKKMDTRKGKAKAMELR
ncbi:unnamed protein product [Vicia faba]|uniref:Uncharacterized protein n=1 Tax=Vicia faba TaxID=3906 RepID=A0AAV1B831_VICFA|nr:unnamed protein product [Vicia faba]